MKEQTFFHQPIRPPGEGGKWSSAQTGHRERYGIPRALAKAGMLDLLITDIWVRPGSWISMTAPGAFGRRLRDRYHAEVGKGRVLSFPWKCLAWEAAASVHGLRGPKRVLARNAWWGRTASLGLKRHVSVSTRFLFGYCYESHSLFLAARELGIVPILGQIDPGPKEDDKMAEIAAAWPQYSTPFRRGSSEYYDAWREECRLASGIVVNSAWSKAALESEGIAAAKIAVIPLVYSPPSDSVDWRRVYPAEFTTKRPLRVLFLGQCILRKGIAETIAAAQRISQRPVEFTLVGNTDISGFERHFGHANIRYFRRVSRAECQAFYRDADIFLFPTHSDGFGLTQLEAQAWKLPIISSRYCGEVVEDRRTGWILDQVSSGSIIKVIEEILAEPKILERFSRNITPWSFGLDELGSNLRLLETLASRAS